MTFKYISLIIISLVLVAYFFRPRPQPIQIIKTPAGGIVPHHLLAQKMISDFYQQVGRDFPDTVLLIGPNHQITPSHPVITDSNQSFLKHPLIFTDDTLIKQEISISASLPFIKQFLPEANVIPLILSHRLSLDDLNSLSIYLESIIDENTIVVASVDFSHYLSFNRAKQNDQKTLQLMKEYNLPALLELNSDYLDSPPSIILFLQLMKLKNTTTPNLLNQLNSAEITNNYSLPTTGYFSIIYQ